MKGFVFIGGVELMLRFMVSGAFAAMEKRHNLTYVILRVPGEKLDAGVLPPQLTAGRDVVWLESHPGRFEVWRELFDASCILHRSSSTSFEVRVQEYFRKNEAEFQRLSRLARPDFYPGYRRRLERRLGLHPEMFDLVKARRPDFFVLPSTLLDWVTDDVLQLGHETGIPTLMLVAGWDNLSSKGLLFHQPTMMGVWGEQSKRHASEIQGADPRAVRIVGAPHYEQYKPSSDYDRGALRKSLGAPEDGLVLLFAGTFRLFDETQLLKEIDDSIESGLLPKMHLIYRPHPWRQSREHEGNFLDHSWRHISLDPQMSESYRSAMTTGAPNQPGNFLFRMNHLVDLYRAVDGVISPMSTVLLEAMLFGLPTMAIAFSDGKHSWSADKVSQMYHFKELYEIPEVLVSRSRERFPDLLRELVSRVGDAGYREQIRNRTQYFVFRDQRTYAERVAEVLDEMLAEVGPAHRPRYRGRRGYSSLEENPWYNSLPVRALRKLRDRSRRALR